MAGKDFNLKAILSCVDKISPVLKPMQNRIKALQTSFKTLSRVAANSARRIAAPAGILSGVLGYSFGSAVKSYAAYADSLAAVADKSGVAADQLQKLRYAASVNGSSAETMDAALIKLNKTLYDAAYGKNKDAASMFQTLGIKIKNADGSVRSAADVLPQLAEGLRLNTNNATRTAMAMTAFGKSGTDLLPLLTQGDKGLAAMAKRAEELGLTMSNDAVKAGGELNNTFAEVNLGLQATTGEIVKTAIPVIKDIAEASLKWLKANREIIGVKIAEFLKTLSSVLENFPWEGLKWFAGAVLGAKFATMAASVVQAGVAFAGALGPVGLVIAALAGVGTAVYANWDKIGPYFKGVWDSITGIFDKSITAIKGLVDTLSGWVPEWLKSFFKSGDKSITVNTQGGDGGAVGLGGPNPGAVAASASGSVTGSADVFVHQADGTVQQQKMGLRGGVKVGGNAGQMRPAFAGFGGD